MRIDYSTITAWVAIVTAMTAITALWIESRRARFSLGLDLLFKLIGKFSSEELIKERRLVSKGLQSKKAKRGDKWEVAVGDILDRFQLVGILMKRGTLDRELVHSEYYYWVSHYYYYLNALMKDWRQLLDDPTMWEDVDYLHKELTAIERKYRHATSIVFSEINLSEFLSSEANL